MSAVSERAAQFHKKFNELLGSKIGRELKPRTYYEPKALEQMIFAKMIQEGRKASKEAASPKKSKSKSSSGDKLTPAQIEERTKALLKKSGITGGEKKGFWEKIGGTVKGGLELIARPSAAVAGYAKHGIEALNQGEPIWSIGDDLLYGARRGITGKEHVGMGDVIAEGRKRTPQGYHDPISGGLARLMGANPIKGPFSGLIENTPLDTQKKVLPKKINKFVTQQQDRAGGFFGDIATDPLTYTGLKGITAATGAIEGTAELTGKAVGQKIGKQVTEAVLKTSGRGRVAEGLGDDAAEIIGKMTREIQHGATSGRVRGLSKEFYNSMARKIGETARQRIAQGPLMKLSKFARDAQAGNAWQGGALTNALRDPLFERGYNIFLQARHGGANYDDALKRAADAVFVHLDDEVEVLVKAVKGGLETGIEKKVMLKFAGQEVAEIPKLGKAIKKTGEFLEDTPLARLRSSASHAAQNPGRTAEIASGTRSGIKYEADQFTERLKQVMDTVSESDQHLLTDILDGTATAPPHLQQIAAELRGYYDAIHGRDVSRGVRRAADYSPNFTYQRIHKMGNKANEWNVARKDALRGQGDPLKFSTQEAKAAGLRPHTNAFDNLNAYNVRTLQKSAPQRLSKALGKQYATAMKLPADSAAEKAYLHGRNLVKVPANEIPEELRATLTKGHSAVMDKDLYEIVRRYREMVRPNSLENRDLIRSYDFILGKFKKMATIYRPGFHFKNVISDAFIGSMDGIGPNQYKKVFGVLENAGSTKGASQAIGGHTWDELATNFKQHLSSGFITEEGLGTAKVRGRVGKAIQDLSERREDWGRFSHFYGAVKDEYDTLIRRGMPEAKAWEEATDNAIYRVNKYKLDYGALTKGEAKYARRILPFYTFTRKIIPLLAESAFISPRNLSIAQRLVTQGQERLPSDTPGWLRDTGFIPFGKGENPVGAALGQILPINNLSELAENPMASMAPALTLPLDLASGHDVFSHKPIAGDNALEQFADALKNKLPPLQQYRQMFPKRNVNEDTGESSITPILQRVANLLGVPVRKVTPAQADQELRAQISNLQSQMKKLDERAQKQGYSAYWSERGDGVSLRIKDNENGDIIGEFDDIHEAAAALKKLLND